jgi:hypothetical protein
MDQGIKGSRKMTDTATPNIVDDCRKLLDSGHMIVLYCNQMGSYTAAVVSAATQQIVGEEMEAMPDDSKRLTDDFTPSDALYRLTEKLTTGRIV